MDNAATGTVVQSIIVDQDRKLIVVNGTPVLLTRAEFALVEYLSAYPEHVKSRTQCIEHIYGNTYVEDRNIDSLVKRVRAKVKSFGTNPIKTRQTFGYFWHI